MSLESVDYKLKDNEIILLDSLLNIEYFDYLVVQENEKYARYKTYDTTQPLHSINYVNNERLNDLLKPIDDIDEKLVPLKKSTDKKEGKEIRNFCACILLSKGILRKKVTGKIETMLPKKAFEIKYKGSEHCSFELLIQGLRTYIAYQKTLHMLQVNSQQVILKIH